MGKHKELNEKQLEKMLRMADEQDWLEFKGEWKLYKSDDKVADKSRDEFIKDILGLANGNSHTIRKTKYMIFGVDNTKFDENGERLQYNVDYRVPTQSEIAHWLKDACSPAVVGLECEKITYKGNCIFVITIPPTFELHETARGLTAAGGTFHKHTVFMRQDEHTVPACVRDGVTIQQLKHLHRQEVTNPSAAWIGAIVGGIVGFITSQANIRALQMTEPVWESVVLTVLTGGGILFGASIGIITRWFNETRYDWRYMTWKQRMFVLAFGILFVTVYLLIVRG